MENSSEPDPTNLEGVIDYLARAARRKDDRVSVGDIFSMIGPRSFGPLVLIPGFIAVSPIGAIPGVPGVMAVIEILVTSQMLVGLDHFWLPEGLKSRSIKAGPFRAGLRAIRPYARFVDRVIAPRWTVLTRGPFFYVIAFLCLLISFIMPIIELVPLAGIVPNAALTAFGVAITAHDGIWALLAISFTVASLYLLFAMI